MATKKTVSKPQAVTEPKYKFIDLRSNEHTLRITDPENPNRVVAELRWERDVFGWDKIAGACDSSRLRMGVFKPIGEVIETRKDGVKIKQMLLVKDYASVTKPDTRVIWLGDRILREEAVKNIDTI